MSKSHRLPNSKRMQLDASTVLCERIEYVRNELDAVTFTEATRWAFKAAALLLSTRERGAKIYIEEPNGERTQVVLL